ncbi:MAG: hypothetical protein RIQ79_1753, partial [Verrucomicrobiota bacterium]
MRPHGGRVKRPATGRSLRGKIKGKGAELAAGQSFSFFVLLLVFGFWTSGGTRRAGAVENENDYENEN